MSVCPAILGAISDLSTTSGVSQMASTGKSARTTPRRLGMVVTPAISRMAKEMSESMEGAMASDAVALLEQDHRKVEALFEQFENAESRPEKAQLAAQICLELRLHTQIEEELLYPPAHKAAEADLVDEAIVEHATAKDLIKQIEGMKPSDELYDAKVKVLSEYIKHHVKEEEKEMFPQLRESNLDLTEIGDRLKTRKAELLERLMNVN
jgi:hemerythrin superfamily protein